jgi:flagellar capping protein FliD
MLDGMAITASSNRVTDAIAGTTLELFTTTTGNASLDFSQETHPALKPKYKPW